MNTHSQKKKHCNNESDYAECIRVMSEMRRTAITSPTGCTSTLIDVNSDTVNAARKSEAHKSSGGESPKMLNLGVNNRRQLNYLILLECMSLYGLLLTTKIFAGRASHAATEFLPACLFRSMRGPKRVTVKCHTSAFNYNTRRSKTACLVISAWLNMMHFRNALSLTILLFSDMRSRLFGPD